MRFIEWWKDHPIEDDVKMLEWSDDRELGGAAYVDWYPFDHPQLGAVEIGGWDYMGGIGNAPLHLLEREVAPHSDWAVQLALISPRLEVRSLRSEPVGSGAHRVVLVLHNTGWMPTNVSQKAIDRKAVRPVEVEIELPDGGRLAVRRATPRAWSARGPARVDQHAGMELGRASRAASARAASGSSRRRPARGSA